MEAIKLPPERIALLREHQRALNDMIGELDKAEECGVDCTYHRGAIAEANSRITNLIKHYGENV